MNEKIQREISCIYIYGDSIKSSEKVLLQYHITNMNLDKSKSYSVKKEEGTQN